MIDSRVIDKIQTPEVRDVLWAYREFYYLGELPELTHERRYRVCGCSPQTGQWPHNRDAAGTPLVCEAHEWRDKQRALQAAIVSSYLSEPIPMFTKTSVDTSRIPACTHPLCMKPYFWVPKPLGKRSGRIAAYLSKWLTEDNSLLATHSEQRMHSRQHVVFYVHHSHAMSLCYERREQAVRDILLYAPVLVYWHNQDQRHGNGWMLQLIESRQYGLAFIVEE